MVREAVVAGHEETATGLLLRVRVGVRSLITPMLLRGH